MSPSPFERRHALILRSSALRARLLHDARPLAHTVAGAESGLRVAARVCRHPEWIAAGMLGMMLLRPGRLAAWARGATFGLRAGRGLLPLLAALRR